MRSPQFLITVIAASLFCAHTGEVSVNAFTFLSPTTRSRFLVSKKSTSSVSKNGRLLSSENPFENVFQARQSLFGGDNSAKKSADNPATTEFDSSPAGLIFQAKRLVACDLGLLDPTLLDDNSFRWIDANNNAAIALSKTEYIAAGRFFNLRGAFPNIDYRAHDYRVVEGDTVGATVRLTCRVQGTMRGELRLRNGIVVPPSGLVMRCPPEAVSITFDLDSGKVIKLCTGFAMDRLVGNTGGTTGVIAASIIAGKPAVSDWDLYPATTVLSRIFARPAKPLDDAESYLAPFPEQVMIQLAKGVLGSAMGYDDPSLLSDRDFTFVTPTIGPIRKREFLEKYAEQEFQNVDDPQFSAFRVDPYDPVRVWVDVQPVGPGYFGPPQAMSLAFDDNGYCTRITSWAVMDPSIGNAGGLGGPEGYKYATGAASLGLASRSLPTLLGRFKKRVLSPITGINVDSYTRGGTSDLPSLPAKASNNSPSDAAGAAANQGSDVSETVMKRLESIKELGASIRIVPPSIPTMSIKAQTQPPISLADTKATEKKKQDSTAKVIQKEKTKQAQISAAAKKKVDESKAEKAKLIEAQKAAAAAQETKRRQQLAAQRAAVLADEARRKQQLEAEKETEKRKRQAEADREKAAKAKLAAVSSKVDKRSTGSDGDQQRRQQAALEILSKAASRATVALFGLGGKKLDDATSPTGQGTRSTAPVRSTPAPVSKVAKQAPPGVPTLTKWRKNSDNSITGLVRGSKGFDDGARVTTSPIQSSSNIMSGEVVKTGSGSRYFLE